MLHYWKINKRGFYSSLLISSIVFLLSLFYLKTSSQSLISQLLFNLVISFGIFSGIYFVNFLVSFNRFKALASTFSKPPFSDLPKEIYKIYETKPLYMLVLAELTIMGYSNNYPVRIEYEKGAIVIIIGVQKQNLKQVEKILNIQNLSLNDLGIVKKLKLKDFPNSLAKRNLTDIIADITSLLKKNNVEPYEFRTT